MALFIDILKDKYNIDTSKENNKENKLEVKKSGLFTGIKSSQTYEKNNLKHIIDHSLNKNKSNENSLGKLIENSYNFFENSNLNGGNSSVVYRKNIKTIDGTNKLAFPHGAVAKTINKETPDKPRNGIGVSTIFNRSTLYNKHIQDLKNIPKLFQNQKENQNG